MANPDLHRAAMELRWVALQLEKAHVAGLKKQLAQATRDAFKPLQREIKAEAAKTLPRRGGYAGIMSRAVRVTVSRRGLDVTARVWARGRGQLRDVRTVNLGRLRHPVWGRRRQPWKTTQVPPGFVTRPWERMKDDIVHGTLDGLEEIARQVAFG